MSPVSKHIISNFVLTRFGLFASDALSGFTHITSYTFPFMLTFVNYSGAPDLLTQGFYYDSLRDVSRILPVGQHYR